jgi:hypothetical protein
MRQTYDWKLNLASSLFSYSLLSILPLAFTLAGWLVCGFSLEKEDHNFSYFFCEMTIISLNRCLVCRGFFIMIPTSPTLTATIRTPGVFYDMLTLHSPIGSCVASDGLGTWVVSASVASLAPHVISIFRAGSHFHVSKLACCC